MKRIALIHTSDVHVATFDEIFERLGPDVQVTHDVAEHLLDNARTDGLDSVRLETLNRLQALSGADAVLCTCSTLGPLADSAGVIRIDRPLMQAACGYGANVRVALCLESTRPATLALLADTAQDMDVTITPQLSICASAWPHFEAGDMDAFAHAVADQIKADVAANGADCIVLAQASMRVAEPLLQDLGVAVISSPELAVQAAITAAAQ